MCGRFSLATSRRDIKEQLGVDHPNPLELRFNIAPTQAAYVITNEAPRQLQQLNWGLVPHWSKEGKNAGKLINARSETIATKASFRQPIRQRRCLVLADSFYEWRGSAGQKIPHRILRKDRGLFTFAGIWDRWTDGQHRMDTFSIITTEANEEVRPLHHRMPVMLLEPAARRRWLTDLPLEAHLAQLHPPSPGHLEYYRVSTQLNSVANDSATLHQKVVEPPTLF
ncbi:MAG: SOS response-associated peptidase [Bacteroidota bacterium]